MNSQYKNTNSKCNFVFKNGFQKISSTYTKINLNKNIYSYTI